MEHIEQTVRRNDTAAAGRDKIKYNICLALACAFSASAALIVIIAFSAVKPVLFVPAIISIIIAVVFFWLKDEMLLEYDYIVEDDILTVAKIRNLSTRKEILHIPVKSFKRLENATPERLSTLENKISCSLNENKRLLFFEENGRTRALIFEPNEEFVRQIERELKKGC